MSVVERGRRWGFLSRWNARIGWGELSGMVPATTSTSTVSSALITVARVQAVTRCLLRSPGLCPLPDCLSGRATERFVVLHERQGELEQVPFGSVRPLRAGRCARPSMLMARPRARCRSGGPGTDPTARIG